MKGHKCSKEGREGGGQHGSKTASSRTLNVFIILWHEPMMLDHTHLKVSSQTKTDKVSFCLPNTSAPKRARQHRIRRMQGFELIQSDCGIAQITTATS